MLRSPARLAHAASHNGALLLLLRRPQLLPKLQEDLMDVRAFHAGRRAAQEAAATVWSASKPAVDRRSVFVGHAARARSPAEARRLVEALKVADKKMARATHQIVAWRIAPPPAAAVDAAAHGSSTETEDVQAPQTEESLEYYDNAGETPAGERVLSMMQAMEVTDAVVVVTRWYGGVKLGPDRYKHISNVARKALENGGFYVPKGKKGKSKKHKHG